MKPVAQTAVATIQQVGRKISSAYSSNSRNGICRVVGSVGSVPSILSQQKKQQSSMAATTRTQLTRLTQKVVAAAAAQSREKSSMSIDYDGSEASATKTTANATYDQSVREPFPSIVVGPEKFIEPQGSFAEAQAQFLDPDMDMVETLKEGLLKTDMGIVAHYYMDVELQGILQSLKNSHPDLKHRVGIADSLKMGDQAVDMCRDHGVTSVVCLGVDFMSESVQAILDKNGFGDVPVYRATTQHIGCSLAESAETEQYRAWLHTESKKALDEGCVPLHVIYINTSLETKAVSSSIVPTITCTSSNVVQTMLQAASEIPNLRVMYGPDTYMGQNLERLFEVIEESDDWTDERIQSELHPGHNNATLKALKDNVVVFPQGNCVVHHMFGNQVTDTVIEKYENEPDTYITAHLEVPGEMFEIGMRKSLNDEGVVGSTADILKFISRKVQDAANSATSDNAQDRKLRFILGTEAGMVTSIVEKVQEILGSAYSNSKGRRVEAEIIFPVSSEAVMSLEDCDTSVNDELTIVPGVAGGEGCSTAGGCATCPFMKMNDVDALQDIIDLVDEQRQGDERSRGILKKHLPPTRLQGKFINGIEATELGTEAILFMRKFMLSQSMPEDLVAKVKTFEATSLSR
uniref:quinolinate synthase n=1 Tax=Pseudo-nitzschia australis TaxID=44445 RepID=A0A7S4EPT1_9STRA|mmetsp:Transcript_19968/g.43422  ORF Transcript_19968/g.43422 Transcript_19968/m.43422 type:complete len:633 (-) Transcript_19968:130-2028(-)